MPLMLTPILAKEMDVQMKSMKNSQKNLLSISLLTSILALGSSCSKDVDTTREGEPSPQVPQTEIPVAQAPQNLNPAPPATPPQTPSGPGGVVRPDNPFDPEWPDFPSGPATRPNPPAGGNTPAPDYPSDSDDDIESPTETQPRTPRIRRDRLPVIDTDVAEEVELAGIWIARPSYFDGIGATSFIRITGHTVFGRGNMRIYRGTESMFAGHHLGRFYELNTRNRRKSIYVGEVLEFRPSADREIPNRIIFLAHAHSEDRIEILKFNGNNYVDSVDLLRSDEDQVTQFNLPIDRIERTIRAEDHRLTQPLEFSDNFVGHWVAKRRRGQSVALETGDDFEIYIGENGKIYAKNSLHSNEGHWIANIPESLSQYDDGEVIDFRSKAWELRVMEKDGELLYFLERNLFYQTVGRWRLHKVDGPSAPVLVEKSNRGDTELYLDLYLFEFGFNISSPEFFMGFGTSGKRQVRLNKDTFSSSEDENECTKRCRRHIRQSSAIGYEMEASTSEIGSPSPQKVIAPPRPTTLAPIPSQPTTSSPGEIPAPDVDGFINSRNNPSAIEEPSQGAPLPAPIVAPPAAPSAPTPDITETAPTKPITPVPSAESEDSASTVCQHGNHGPNVRCLYCTEFPAGKNPCDKKNEGSE